MESATPLFYIAACRCAIGEPRVTCQNAGKDLTVTFRLSFSIA
jgi:hypothetical protein